MPLLDTHTYYIVVTKTGPNTRIVLDRETAFELAVDSANEVLCITAGELPVTLRRVGNLIEVVEVPHYAKA